MISIFSNNITKEINMQLNIFRKLAILATIILAFVTFSAASTQNLVGIISDDMCKSKHMMPGSDADCINACVKAGSKYALVVGNKIYVLKGEPNQLAKWAGKKVNVSGDVQNSLVSVLSISEAK